MNTVGRGEARPGQTITRKGQQGVAQGSEKSDFPSHTIITLHKSDGTMSGMYSGSNNNDNQITLMSPTQ